MKAAVQQDELFETPINLKDKIESRRSKELVIAFISPIGSGITHIINTFNEKLDDRGYDKVIPIKLSDLLKKFKEKTEIDSGGSENFKRYRDLQEAGKLLREKSQNHAILAEYAASAITIERERFIEAKEYESEKIYKIAYLVDQIKRPEEVDLLRAIYRNNFYLVGITRSKNERSESLKKENIFETEVTILIETDRNEGDKNGQKVDKALHLSDFFINNSLNYSNETGGQVDRFLGLLHGEKNITPKIDEMGMYAAYMAGLKSACLSRQVGASIATAEGEIISTGCNDVPKFGGGLYFEGLSPDSRCMHQEGAECHNDKHKNQIKKNIEKIVNEELLKIRNLDTEIIKIAKEAIINKIQKETRIGSLIEFSRAVHAEMDAIISLARVGGSSVKNTTLYTTTFPCHNCARHIVTAGIKRVVYIEPYEKSLALDLHADSIDFDQKTTEYTSKVNFSHFSGVAPHRFHFLFHSSGRKDDNGKFIKIKKYDEVKKLPEYLDSYRDFEKKAVENFQITYNSVIDNSTTKQ